VTSKPVVLYVEDDPASQRVMSMLFDYVLGIPQYTIFPDSQDFITRLERLSPQPDMIILDVHIAPHNGFEVLKMVRDHQHFSQTTVIALTAGVMPEEVDQLKEAGFDSCISKPINPKVFPGLMDRIITGEKVWELM